MIYGKYIINGLMNHSKHSTKSKQELSARFRIILIKSVIPDRKKPFRELIVHIGNRNDTTSDSGYGKLTGRILEEYYKSFQIRNPNLRIFAAQLRMDTPTSRLEIGFVPFTTGSKRGLATRVCPSDRRLYNRDFADEVQEIQLCRYGYFLKKNSSKNS